MRSAPRWQYGSSLEIQRPSWSTCDIIGAARGVDAPVKLFEISDSHHDDAVADMHALRVGVEPNEHGYLLRADRVGNNLHHVLCGCLECVGTFDNLDMGERMADGHLRLFSGT